MQFSSFFISKIFALKLSIVLQKSINDSLSIDRSICKRKKKERKKQAWRKWEVAFPRLVGKSRARSSPVFEVKPARLKKSLGPSYHHRAGILLVQAALDHRRGENSGQTVEAICNGSRGACAMLVREEGRGRGVGTRLTTTIFDLSAAFSRWK